jgi:hypothetical protein
VFPRNASISHSGTTSLAVNTYAACLSISRFSPYSLFIRIRHVTASGEVFVTLRLLVADMEGGNTGVRRVSYRIDKPDFLPLRTKRFLSFRFINYLLKEMALLKRLD